MKVSRIFLDVDDVCNKLTMYALWSMGCSCVKEPEYSDRIYNPTWGFDIVRAANSMLIGTGVRYTKKTFWDNVSREVWSTTPYSDEFAMIVKQCRLLVGRSKVTLLTKPIDDPECYAGKHEWIRSRCPRWLRDRAFIGGPKDAVAFPDALLIDDSDENYDDFISAGGQAILVPRPWNRLHGYDTMEYLRECFAHLGLLKIGYKVNPLPDDPLTIAYGMERKTFDELNE